MGKTKANTLKIIIMKKITLAALFALTLISAAFATGRPNADFVGSYNFNKSFPHATVVAVRALGRFTKVNFIWNNMKMEAYYDQDGALFATSHNIPVKNLPLSCQLQIRKEYPDFTATEAIEFSQTDQELLYYVSIINADKTYILQISGNNISVFKKMRY